MGKAACFGCWHAVHPTGGCLASRRIAPSRLPPRRCCQAVEQVLGARCGCNRQAGRGSGCPTLSAPPHKAAASGWAFSAAGVADVRAPLCSVFLEIRGGLQADFPTLTPAYLTGANLILATACRAADTSCL